MLVRDNPDKHRYELVDDTQIAGFTTHKLRDGRTVSCHALVVASGVSVRTLDAPGVAGLTGAGSSYGAAMIEAANY